MYAARFLAAAGIVVCVVGSAAGQDWSQWRGDRRDGKATAFEAPATWPKELTKKWSVSIGDGVATPSLVGDRLYVFGRQDGNEVARCLNAADGSEIWKDSYASEGTTGGASGFQGPRCSPTVVDGKVITLGVRGVLSCLDAETGKVLWRKTETGGWPQFYTSSSPIVVDGLCIAELGGEENGAIVAFDIDTGEEKWRVEGLPPSYGSPVLMEISGIKLVIAPVQDNLVGIDAATGKERWKIQYTQGRNNSATPIVDGETLYLAGPGSGMSAIGLDLSDEEIAEEQLWNITDNSVQFSTPVLKDGLLFGLSNNNTLFCIDTTKQTTAWSQPLGGPEPPSPFGPGPFGPGGRRRDRGDRLRDGERPEGERREGSEREDQVRLRPSGERVTAIRLVSASEGLLAQATEQPTATEAPAADAPAAEERREGEDRRGDGDRRGRRGRGRGGRRGGGGYGSIVDADSVLLVLTPAMELVVYAPTAEAYQEIARQKVADSATYAYPVASGNRIFIKDQDAVTLWTVE